MVAVPLDATGPTPPDAALPPRPRPVTLVVCMALLALQAGAFAALAVAVGTGPAPASGAGALYPVVLFTALAALILLVLAVSMWRLRRWTRGAATAWGVLMLLVGLSQLSVNAPVALAVAVVGALTAGLAVAPATRLALVPPSEDADDEGDADDDEGDADGDRDADRP